MYCSGFNHLWIFQQNFRVFFWDRKKPSSTAWAQAKSFQQTLLEALDDEEWIHMFPNGWNLIGGYGWKNEWPIYPKKDGLSKRPGRPFSIGGGSWPYQRGDMGKWDAGMMESTKLDGFIQGKTAWWFQLPYRYLT